jgi:hypothetical protein
LNKVDGEEISSKNISKVLDPFLNGLANCRHRILVQRIKDKIFFPLLENNITPTIKDSDSSDNEEDNKINDKKDFEWGDGGRMSKKT